MTLPVDYVHVGVRGGGRTPWPSRCGTGTGHSSGGVN